MKTIRAFIIGLTVFVGVVGCSTPSPTVARSQHQVSKTAATIEDARLLYEAGRLDDAQHKLEAVLKIDPDNKKAQYYMDVIASTRQHPPQPRGYYQTIPQQPIY